MQRLMNCAAYKCQFDAEPVYHRHLQEQLQDDANNLMHPSLNLFFWHAIKKLSTRNRMFAYQETSWTRQKV